MSNIKRINVGERMSQVVIYNGLVFTAGQVASSAPNKDVGEQTKNVLDKIDNLLKEAGTNKSNLISANINQALETGIQNLKIEISDNVGNKKSVIGEFIILDK